MPEKDGSLTEADQKIAGEWLEKYWTGSARNCPICGSPRWEVGRFLAHIPAGPGILSPQTYPLVSVASNPCGYTLFFNAAIVGIVHREPPKPPEAPPVAQPREAQS